MTKEFDIVVHGATGFTGRLIAEYLLSRSDSGLKWAMGGRSLDSYKQYVTKLAHLLPPHWWSLRAVTKPH